MKIPDIVVSVSNEFIELFALKAECDGMTAENEYRKQLGNAPSYSFDDFYKVVEKMRDLKTLEVNK